MFTISDFIKPQSLDEAYKTLIKHKNNMLLGGCLFLKMSSKMINVAIDLSGLELNYIKNLDDCIEIGSMTNFRDIETSTLLQTPFLNSVPSSVLNIIGVQFRNLATVGASVYSKYGFSDLITALLSLEAEVELFNKGKLTLEDFLKLPYEKDILTKIYIKKKNGKSAFSCFRKSASDFSILNVAASRVDGIWKIAVGARPQRASLAKHAAKYLDNSNLEICDIEKAGEIASKELNFGTNMRGSEEYRRSLCKVLIKRAVLEVLK